ncbi:MAG: M23 family metallopeptidase [Erythrobacter sp.]|nr:M23 family metallopeptidase [Erythrobacter sp.]
MADVVSNSEESAAEPAVAALPTPDPAPTPTPAPIRTETLAIKVVSGERTQGGWLRGKVPDGTVSATLGDKPVAVDGEGNFFAAFDRDAPALTVLKATHEVGLTIEHPIRVSPRDWDIERVNVAKRPSGSNEEWWAKREPEWLAIRDARAKETGAQGWKQQFIWPVTGRVSGRFGRQRIYRGEPGSYHSGLDIAPGNGVPFVAPADGVVVLARTGFSLEGGIVILDHGAGLNSAFIHMSRLAVTEGDEVEQGQLLGNVGASGRATGPHLHWSLMWRDSRLDPLLFLPPMP